MGELSEWFKERGYEESFVQQQIGRVQVLDREALIRDIDKQRNQEREDSVPLVTTYHPALSSMMRVVQKLHPMLKSIEEHRKVFLSHLSWLLEGAKILQTFSQVESI